MRRQDQRGFSTQKLKEDFEKNIVLKKFFRAANKVKLSSTKRYNSKEGLIHFKRRLDTDGDEGGPSAQRFCLMSQFDD